MTIQQIFQQEYLGYKKTHALPKHKKAAGAAIRDCRTEKLGGHIQACPDGHYERHWYNSCKHRMCPQCAFIQIERWLLKQKARILQCAHYHVIFTISDELHVLWCANVRLLTNILFACAYATLFELLGDPRHLGAQPGMIASLHTWSRTLTLHPHIHCLVTGGGLTKDGRWVPVTGGYLLPFRIVRDVFRAKVLDEIRKAYTAGKLRLPEGMSAQQFSRVLIESASRKWNVRLCEEYRHGGGVLTYLARYLRGGPIKNSRIVSIHDGRVTFIYGRKNRESMQLPAGQFISRFLQHTPETGSILVRYYGLYHPSRKAGAALCRKHLGTSEVVDPGFLDWQTYCEARGDAHPELCPVCSKLMVCRQLRLSADATLKKDDPWQIPPPAYQTGHAQAA